MKRAAAAVSILWGVSAGLWLLSVTGRGLPVPVERGAVALTLLATLGLGGAWVARALRRARASRDPLLLLAPSLLAVALAVRLVGLDHEVGELFYLDEGTYSHHAAEINRGQLLQKDFVYPHLLYYLDAFALWIAGLFREGVAGAAAALYGLEEWQAVRRLVMRLVVALAGAATVLPVFALGRRLAGPLAGAAGGLLIVFSPLYNDGSHLAICDVPSAFFAALCLAATARLLEGEEGRWYLLAGAAAGLAAAAKYPAGLVAVAPLAVWIHWRVRDRRFQPGLLQAGLAALGLFLATNPGLLAYPERALYGRRGVFFGAYQYGGEGWFGAVPPNAPLWYLGQLSWGFGWPVLILGLGGLVLLPAAGRRRLLWLLPFPVLYLGLIFALDVVVARNLYPALPPLAALLGAGVVTAFRRLAGDGGRLRPVLASAGACAVLALPVIRTVFQDAALARPGTRVLAREWIRENVPRGATILRENYTPDLSPAEYDDERLGRVRFVAALPVEEVRRPEIDFVLLSSGAYQRFFNAQGNTGARERQRRERYQTIFETFPLVERFQPGRTRLGPELRLYRVVPVAASFPTELRSRPGDLFVPDGGMRAGRADAIEFTREGQWALAKGFLEPGRYRLRVRGRITGPGSVTVRGLATRYEARLALDGPSVALRLPARDKYFLYIARPPGSRIAEIELARLPETARRRGPYPLRADEASSPDQSAR